MDNVIADNQEIVDLKKTKMKRNEKRILILSFV